MSGLKGDKHHAINFITSSQKKKYLMGQLLPCNIGPFDHDIKGLDYTAQITYHRHSPS